VGGGNKKGDIGIGGGKGRGMFNENMERSEEKRKKKSTFRPSESSPPTGSKKKGLTPGSDTRPTEAPKGKETQKKSTAMREGEIVLSL